MKCEISKTEFGQKLLVKLKKIYQLQFQKVDHFLCESIDHYNYNDKNINLDIEYRHMAHYFNDISLIFRYISRKNRVVNLSLIVYNLIKPDDLYLLIRPYNNRQIIQRGITSVIKMPEQFNFINDYDLFFRSLELYIVKII